MAHERPESQPLGRLVVEQRHRLSLSQTDVVRRAHSAAKAEGRQSGATKQWISEIERTGRIPHPDALRWLAVAIEVPVARMVAAADEQRRLRRPDASSRRQPKIGGAVQSAARLLPVPVDGQAPPSLVGGVFVPVTNGVTDGVRVDAEAMNAFRAADRHVGGGHLYGTVIHYLRTEVAPRLFGSTVDDGGLLPFSAAVALTDMAGWMAHDADRNHEPRSGFGSKTSRWPEHSTS
jgi:transcriptional regulator with XRE-family HTH domain